MKKLAFVTSKDLPVLTPGDQIAAASLQKRGLTIQPAIWDDPKEPWENFDAVLLRSPWDYHLRPEAFLAWLSQIEAKGVQLWNPLPIIRWNTQKTYLSHLARYSIPTPATRFLAQGEKASLYKIVEENNWEEAIIKPQISAGAFETWRCPQKNTIEEQTKFEQASAELSLVVQPFIPEILTKGEWSLMFFGGEFSHAVLKKPKSGDFRVQEEFGGGTTAAIPGEELIKIAQQALQVAASIAPILYARVDLVETQRGPLLMELELIEPELFFGYDALASERFYQAIQKIL